MTADALEWPIMGLGMVGADFKVISPPELRDQVRDWGAGSAGLVPRSVRPPKTSGGPLGNLRCGGCLVRWVLFGRRRSKWCYHE
jgi:hypothetical protein